MLVERVLRDLDATIQACGGTVTVRPPLLHVLRNDATRAQILLNLLTNALKFVPAGIAPQVTLWTEQRGTWVRVWLSDNGIGIAADHQRRIFGVFQRLHRTEVYPGMGIGLAIVKKGVELWGGRWPWNRSLVGAVGFG